MAEVNVWYKKQLAKIKTEAIERLSAVGLEIGSQVSNSSGIYRITAFEFVGSTPYGGYITVHGVKLRKNCTWETHVHFIGWPKDFS